MCTYLVFYNYKNQWKDITIIFNQNYQTTVLIFHKFTLTLWTWILILKYALASNFCKKIFNLKHKLLEVQFSYFL